MAAYISLHVQHVPTVNTEPNRSIDIFKGVNNDPFQ